MTDKDKLYADTYLELGTYRAVGEKLGVSYTAIYKHMKKIEVKVYLENQKAGMVNHAIATRLNPLASEGIASMDENLGVMDNLKSTEGLLVEAIKIYKDIPEPKKYIDNIIDLFTETIEKHVKDKDTIVDYSKLSHEVIKLLRKETKMNLDISARKSQAYSNVAKYHKDFAETKDEVWEQLLLVSNKELYLKAKEDLKKIKEYTGG